MKQCVSRIMQLNNKVDEKETSDTGIMHVAAEAVPGGWGLDLHLAWVRHDIWRYFGAR